MLSDLLFVLLAVSAIIFMFSSPKPEKIPSGIAEVVGSNPTGPLFTVVQLWYWNEFIIRCCRTKVLSIISILSPKDYL